MDWAFTHFGDTVNVSTLLKKQYGWGMLAGDVSIRD
jgi:hypothetical protein